MSGRNIGDLPMPADRYRVDRRSDREDGTNSFETFNASKVEDERRARGLSKATTNPMGLIDIDQARALAVCLVPTRKRSDPSCSLASSVHMRELRIKVIGAIWRLIVLCRFACTTFTIIPRTWEFTPGELMSVSPVALLRRFRTDLYRKGAAAAGGWLFAYIHGEYDPVAKVFRLHIHGACSLEMVAVLDRLRRMTMYKSVPKLPDGSVSPVYRRVWISRKPLHSLPSPITYLMQSFWPSRPIYIAENGTRRRVRQKRAIQEPYHAMVLLWLDRWQLRDLSLLVGLRVTSTGLKRTHVRR